MSHIDTALPNRSLSSSFERARTLSRVLAGLFAFFFWLMIVYLAVALLLLTLAPRDVTLPWQDVVLPLGRLAPGARARDALWLAVGVMPGLFLLHHARRLFGCFSRGEVFAATAISHIRAAGFWLVVSALATFAAKIGLHSTSGVPGDVEFDIQTLVFGMATFVAAHVMTEARRIADENASFL